MNQDEDRPPPGDAVAADSGASSAELDAHLRAMFDEATAWPVPHELLDLIDRLEDGRTPAELAGQDA